MNSDEMNSNVSHRGGSSIGYLADLDAVAAAAVLYLRMWAGGIDGQHRVQQDLTNLLGDDRGHGAFETFAHLNEMCALHARRPLMHHTPQCKGLCADEACVGQFVSTAADGDAADTRLVATLIVRPDVAPIVAGLAAQFGLAIKQMNLAPLKPRAATHTHQENQTLH